MARSALIGAVPVHWWPDDLVVKAQYQPDKGNDQLNGKGILRYGATMY